MEDKVIVDILDWLDENEWYYIGPVEEYLNSLPTEYPLYDHCSLDNFRIYSVCEDDEHLVNVMMFADVIVSEMKRDSMGDFYADGHTERIEIRFYVDRDAEKGYCISFATDVEGNIDWDAVVIPVYPDDACDVDEY